MPRTKLFSPRPIYRGDFGAQRAGKWNRLSLNPTPISNGERIEVTKKVGRRWKANPKLVAREKAADGRRGCAEEVCQSLIPFASQIGKRTRFAARQVVDAR